MMDIKIDDVAVKKLLQDLSDNKPKLQGVMRVAGLIMKREVERNFDAGGRPSPWAPLAKSTMDKRRKEGHWPGKILVEHGQLVASITMQATLTQAIVGTNKAYAAIHQYGGTITQAASTQNIHFRKYKSGKHKGKVLFSKSKGATFGMKVNKSGGTITIPARPFMVLTDKGLKEIAEKAQAALWSIKKGATT